MELNYFVLQINEKRLFSNQLIIVSRKDLSAFVKAVFDLRQAAIQKVSTMLTCHFYMLLCILKQFF